MAKTQKELIQRLNSELRQELEAMDVRQRIMFYRASQTFGKTGRDKVRIERHSTKAALKRGDW